mmetsp:Transcript_112224/g.322615  ORF Transcript_112224/g.322615 Transcript_112224/m.322615 type:complete len:256 (-) Transcript_112224:247-1014(-)
MVFWAVSKSPPAATIARTRWMRSACTMLPSGSVACASCSMRTTRWVSSRKMLSCSSACCARSCSRSLMSSPCSACSPLDAIRCRSTSWRNFAMSALLVLGVAAAAGAAAPPLPRGDFNSFLGVTKEPPPAPPPLPRRISGLALLRGEEWRTGEPPRPDTELGARPVGSRAEPPSQLEVAPIPGEGKGPSEGTGARSSPPPDNALSFLTKLGLKVHWRSSSSSFSRLCSSMLETFSLRLRTTSCSRSRCVRRSFSR